VFENAVLKLNLGYFEPRKHFIFYGSEKPQKGDMIFSGILYYFHQPGKIR
jgi:hypothetical protein